MEQFGLFENTPNFMAELWDDLPPGEAEDSDGLRYYQRDAYNAIRSWLTGKAQSVLVVMATGLGKTQVFGAVAKHWDGDVLVLAHRDELVDQARKRLEQMTGGYVEVEKAEWSSSPRTHFVVGSVQSFNQKRLDRLGKDRFGLVIFDEAHHAVSPSYRRALEFFNAKRLLVTATPDRGDEKAMGQIAEEVAFVMDIEDGIDAGYLVPIRGRQVTLSEIHLENVGKSGGDFTIGELDEEMLKAVEGVVHETLRLEPHRQAIGFFPGVRSAELAAQKFNALDPGSAAFISADTNEYERKGIVADFKQGRLKRLCNCMVATEGFDAPGASLIIQARPTLSRALYAQMSGRGTRVLPGIVDKIHGKARAAERREAIARSSKPDCMILDFVGNSTKHALVTMEDVLGGSFSDEEVQRAKKKRQESGEAFDAREALLRARREIEQLAKATRAKVRSEVRDFDPFRVFGMSLPDEQRFSSRFGLKPATEKQVAMLKKAGMPNEDVEGLSAGAAKRLIDKIVGRRKHGFANYQQMRILQQWGITQQNVLFDRANEATTYLSQSGFGKRRPVDPGKLNEILFHTRQPGEES